MKEYKFYKSTTLTNINLPGNSNVIFDLANKNKENVILTTELYTSKYYFPIMLSLIRKINDEEVTPFGKGLYLNVLYKLQKGDNEITIYYPYGESETFKKSEDKETLSDTEYNEYYYSTSTTNIVTCNIKEEIIQKYTFNVSGLKIEFIEMASETTLLNNKIYYNSTDTYYISIIYNENNQIYKIQNSLQNNETIEFIYENNNCTSLKVYKWIRIDGYDEEKLISNIQIFKDSNGSITILECINDCENSQRKSTLMVSLDSKTIEALDYISNLSMTINLSGELGHQYIQKISYPLDELNIQYLTDYHTQITSNSNEVTYYLNENYDLIYVSSSEGNVQAYKYETIDRYNLLSVSKPILKLLENNGELILEGEHEYDFEYQKISNSTCPGGSTCHEIRFNNDAESTSAKIHFPVEGGKFDVLSLVMWSSVAEIINENLELTAKLYLLKNDVIRKTIINEDIQIRFTNSQWYLNIATIQAQEDYDEVILEIKPQSLSGDLIDFNFGLFKKNLTTIYKYDEKGKVKKTLNGFNNYNYGLNKDLQELVNQYVVNSYQDKRIVLSENFRKVKEEIEYNDIDNIIYHGYTNSSLDKIFCTFSYLLNEYLESYNDYTNRNYSFEHNTYLLKKETFYDENKTYVYNTEDNKKYNLIKQVIRKNNDTTINEENYTFNDKQNLKTIQQKYNDKSILYSYNYDDYNRLVSIYNDDTLIYRCVYDESGNLIREYDENENSIEYTYDTNNQLTEIKLNSEVKYSFTYKNNLLTTIKNENSRYYDTYTYDDDQKIVKYTTGYQYSPTFKNKLMYDINGQNCGEQIIVNLESHTNEYSNSKNINMQSSIGFEYYLLSEEDELYFTLMNERQYFHDEYHLDYSPVLISRTKQIIPSNIKNYSGADCYTYEEHGLRFMNLQNVVPNYSFDKDVKLNNKYSIFFGLIISSFQEKQLLKIKGEECYLNIIRSNLLEEIKVSLYRSEELINSITIPIEELMNKLHFLTINVESSLNSSNEYDYIFTIYVDGNSKGSINGTLTNKLSSVEIMGSDSNLQTPSSDKLTSIIINPNNNLSLENINKYINKLSDIYNNNGNTIADYDMTINIDNFKYDYFPLNNSFNSIEGIKPNKFKCNNKTESLYDNFYYDKDITGLGFGQYVYALKNQELEYTLPINKSGTIGFRYKGIEGKDVGLFSLSDSSADFSLVLVMGGSGQLTAVLNTTYATYTPSEPFGWNDVIITWSKVVQSSSIETLDYTFKLYVNKELMLEKSLTLTSDLSNVNLVVGNSNQELDGEIETKGYLQKLFYTSAGDIDPEPIYTSFNNYSCKVNEYDEFSKIKNTIIKTTSNNIIKEKYIYENISNRITPIYNSKALIVNNEFKRVETITLDNYGKIIERKEYIPNTENDSLSFNTLVGALMNVDNTVIDEFSNSLRINESFVYDNKGQLTNEGNSVYEYDDLGNITKIYRSDSLIREFTYEGTKLIKYNDINYQYNGLYITKEVDLEGNVLKEYTWEGTKLVEIKDNINNKKYHYIYNAYGLRERKKIYTISEEEDVMEEDICYYYNVKQILMGEIRYIYSEGVYNKQETIKYLFDKRNELYGFIYNGVTYYYVKNILGNIESIYDETGTNVAKYIYTGYGEHSVCYSNGSPTVREDFIGYINRFRYKGYYYDVETKLFWVSSRYYSPELCRFIQPADVSSLNPSNINGLNLYSYVNNNPIGIAYSSFGTRGTASGGMIDYTGGSFNNIIGSGSATNGSKISGSGSIGGSRFGSINWPKANSVVMTHHTVSLIKDPIISWIFGNISYTTTVQLNSAETFYSFSNIGNDGYSVGVGVNLGNWYGLNFYVSSDIGFGSSWQVTPWLTGSYGWSLENGISFSGGIIIGDTTHEITVSVGNGALLGYAACAGIAAIPVPGARAVAATAACIIFIVDLFN